MGLLDDAIREHLELKRRRGADPGEVAREQREVLDSPYEPQSAGAEADHPTPQGVGEAPPALARERVEGEELVPGETAELDMEAVLSDEHAAGPDAAEEDSLEWEVPHRTTLAQPGESASGASAD